MRLQMIVMTTIFTAFLQSISYGKVGTGPVYPLYGAFPSVPPQANNADHSYNETLDEVFDGGFKEGGQFRKHFGKLVEMVRKQRADSQHLDTSIQRQPPLELGMRTVLTWLSQGDTQAFESIPTQIFNKMTFKKTERTIEEKIDLLMDLDHRKPSTFYKSIFKGNVTAKQHIKLIKSRGAKFSNAGYTDVFTLLNKAENKLGYSLIANEGFQSCIVSDKQTSHRFPDRAVANFFKLLTSVGHIDTNTPANFEEDLVVNLSEHLMNLKGMTRSQAADVVCDNLAGQAPKAQACPKLLNISRDACIRAKIKLAN